MTALNVSIFFSMCVCVCVCVYIYIYIYIFSFSFFYSFILLFPPFSFLPNNYTANSFG